MTGMADMPDHSHGYDFTADIDRVIRRLVTLPELVHIDPNVLLTAVSQARTGGSHGTHASVMALRFRDGAHEHVEGKWRWVWPRIVVDGHERRYLVTFFLPRFLEVPRSERLLTLVHELYHISPRCDGDLRRFKGRNHAHGHSRRAYDAMLTPVCEAAEASLHLDEYPLFTQRFDELQAAYGRVTGRMVRNLKPIRRKLA